MKSLSGARGICAFAGIALLAITPIFAQQWSAAQQDALSSFKKYLASVQQGDIKAMVDYWHPKYVSWNYAQDIPTNYDASLRGLKEFFQNYKFLKFECIPLEVQVEGEVAILHVRFSIVIRDSTGKETSSAGPETVILAKKDGKWAMIGLVWIEK